MADEEKDTDLEGQEEEPKKKRGLLKWLLLVVLLAALGGGGYFAYTTFFAPRPPDSANGTAAMDGDGEESMDGEPLTFAMEPFVVNLADPLGRRYLKLAMEIEVKSEADVAQLERNLPKIKDAVLLLLSSKTYTDLAKLEDKILLKKQIVERLNKILGKPMILRVYFTEFVIQ